MCEQDVKNIAVNVYTTPLCRYDMVIERIGTPRSDSKLQNVVEPSTQCRYKFIWLFGFEQVVIEQG